MKQRIITSIILFLAVLFLPYWIYAPLIVLCIFGIPFYWEAIVLGFLIDVLYGGVTGVGARAALVATVLVALMLPLRERIRWHLW